MQFPRLSKTSSVTNKKLHSVCQLAGRSRYEANNIPNERNPKEPDKRNDAVLIYSYKLLLSIDYTNFDRKGAFYHEKYEENCWDRVDQLLSHVNEDPESYDLLLKTLEILLLKRTVGTYTRKEALKYFRNVAKYANESHRLFYGFPAVHTADELEEVAEALFLEYGNKTDEELLRILLLHYDYSHFEYLRK